MIKRNLMIAMFLAILAAPAFAASIQVTWNANTEPDLAGYKVYYGTTSGQYGAPATTTVPSYTIPNVPDKTTYYIAVTAFDTSGNESEKSDEVSVYVPDVTPPAKPTGLMAKILAAITSWIKGVFGVV